MAQILVFGDSIVYGAWDREGGWVERLRKFLFDKEFLVYNLGVSGDTTEDLLNRFEFEAEQRLDENEETIIIFSIGINDTLRTSPEKFKENIRKLIGLAQKFTQKIIFVGLTPVDEEKTEYKNEYIQQYNEIIKSICSENKLLFIDILGDWQETNYKILLEDGLHPNSQGHEKIFIKVKESLVKYFKDLALLE